MNTLNGKYICGNKDRFTSNLQGKKISSNYSRQTLGRQINRVSYTSYSVDFSKMPMKQLESPPYHSKSHLSHPTFSLNLIRA